MLFPSVQFAIFFPIVLTISWALMSRPRLYKPFILLASYVFYAAASWRFCFLLAGMTLGNQLAAVLMGRTESDARRRAIVTCAVALDLAVLGVFKYYSFFAQQFDDALAHMGLGLPPPLVTIALPVAVSFYTFQAISYVVDVKRRLVKPASLLDFSVYLSFFPHLIAGPIVRAREFLPQLAQPRDPDHVAVSSGLWLIALGLVKKVVIADYLARALVEPVFAVPQAYAGPDLLLGAYGYAAQIYCDFSGYTDIAIGLALLMGYVFPQNFRSPYRATGFRDFWRRWHMTLSRFLRDFLYIPLGGNRGGRLLTYRNLMLTMVLGGLWHGAAWTFVLWGAYNGLGLVAEHALGGRIRTPGWLRWLVTFHLIVFGWILFRSQSLALLGVFLSRLSCPARSTLWTAPVLIAIALVIGLQLLPAQPLRAPAGGHRARAPGAARCRPGARHSVRRRHGSQPGRPALHLLPLLAMSRAPQQPRHEDDNLMGRFDRHGLRRFRARDGIYAVLLAAVVLVLTQGPSIRKAGDQTRPGVGRTFILAVGDPAAWIAERLPLASATNSVTALVSPNQSLGSEGGFSSRPGGASASQFPSSRPTPLTRARSAPRLRRASRCTRCWSPETRCRRRWTQTSRSAWTPTACT